LIAAPAPALAQVREPPPLVLEGTPIQSGVMIGRTAPGARVRVDDVDTEADGQGVFVFGFDRDAPLSALITATTPGGTTRQNLSLFARTYQTRTISGLPAHTVTPPPAARARIEREQAIKSRAFASRAEGSGFLEPWRWPVRNRITSPWGAQRVLNGTPQRPHYGVDLGVPLGTPVLAPASGTICIAEPDLYFEGGMVGLDHGQGLITMYLHMSRLDVAVGQKVVQGATLGLVGAKGRATGPHLCWRMRWRGRQMDPSLRVAA
jgi:murein DD-endopeptidase MepM/ murein hydrolase activator NlpD